jgi:hypothetical protein
LIVEAELLSQEPAAMNYRLKTVALVAAICIAPRAVPAATSGAADLTTHWAGFVALGIFVAAYLLVIAEEATRLRKSKPVVVAAGLLWIVVAVVFAGQGRAA